MKEFDLYGPLKTEYKKLGIKYTPPKNNGQKHGTYKLPDNYMHGNTNYVQEPKTEVSNPQDTNYKNEINLLKREIQSLKDIISKMQRTNEDLFYNLDDDNFSDVLIREKNNMKTQIKLNAGEISSKVSKEANYASAYRGETAPDDTSILWYDTVAEIYKYYNIISETWESVEDGSIYSVFKQIPDGFEFKGNVIIDGNAVVTKNLKLTGNVTWDMTNSPVASQYSINGTTNWHDTYTSGDMFMRMSFDGRKTWSNVVKVVGKDGSNANVTPETVFNALTDGGKTQGLFNANGDLYINATYLKAGTITGIEINGVKFKTIGSNGTDSGNRLQIGNDTGIGGDIRFYYNSDNRGTITQNGGSFSIFPGQNAQMVLGSDGRTTFARGNWNFTGTTITGLSTGAVFG